MIFMFKGFVFVTVLIGWTYPFSNNFRQLEHGQQPLHLLWSDPLVNSIPMHWVGLRHFMMGGTSHLMAEGVVVAVNREKEVIPGHSAATSTWKQIFLLQL